MISLDAAPPSLSVTVSRNLSVDCDGSDGVVNEVIALSGAKTTVGPAICCQR